MQLDVAFVPSLIEELDLTSRTIVVVDILRATSTMITAFHHGAAAIIPVKTVDEAFEIAEKTPQCLLMGEVASIKPDGFHFDNSPVELSKQTRLTGATLVMRSTNGTRLIKKLEANGASEILIGSFLNLSALAAYLVKKTPEEILICCAGDSGAISTEDIGFAGALAMEIQKADTSVLLTDAATVSLQCWQQSNQDIMTLFSHSNHARDLIDLGKTQDLAYIAQTTLPIIPVFQRQSGCIKCPAKTEPARSHS